MSDEVASKRAKFDVKEEDMKRIVECPICFNMPRDGVMLLCINGHNVCATCKTRLETNNAKCPQGNCNYDDPPRRNRTVADLVDKLPFEFPCKFAKAKDVNHSSCEFKDTIDMLKRHEIMCEHRSVKCLRDACKVILSADKIIEHYTTTHNAPVPRKSTDTIETGYLWRQEHKSSSECFGWSEFPRVVSTGFVFPNAYFREGQIFIWLQMVAHSSVTEKLKCEIKLRKDDFLMTDIVPINPIDWTREEIIENKGCMCVNIWNIQKILTEDIAEEEKKNGYCAKFKVTFKIIKKNA
jgi:hypothetical protein